MSRVPVLTLENAPEAARPFLQTALNNSGYIPNLLGVLANAPAALETYLTVSGLNAKASLGLPERKWCNWWRPPPMAATSALPGTPRWRATRRACRSR